MNTNTAIIAMVFMVALSFAAVAAVSFATFASAVGRPAVSFCGEQRQGAGDCARATHPTGPP